MIDDRTAAKPRLRATSKVTSKLQVTLPKAIADAFGIRPGDEIAWIATETALTVLPPRSAQRTGLTAEQRLELFEQQQERVRELTADPEYTERWRRTFGDLGTAESDDPGARRGWTRDDLYEDRGLPRRH
jgi:AbrB family looped-hinge helix DNA binding protein